MSLGITARGPAPSQKEGEGTGSGEAEGAEALGRTVASYSRTLTDGWIVDVTVDTK